LTSAGQVFAQDPPPKSKKGDEAQKKADGAAPAKERKLPGPKYLNLRYDEDFSYLDDAPGTYKEDFFDPIKNIHLDEDWRLTLGGEFRFQMHSETNKGFGVNARTQDTFTLYRYMLHADLKYKDVFRLFAQGIAAFDEDRDLAPRGIDENRWDVQQLFFDLRICGADCPVTLRIGRQELQYGKQYFVSPLDWANTRRRFDAVKLFAHGEQWDVDFFFAKPVVVQRKQRDRFNEDYDLYGVYTTYKGIPRHGIEGFAFLQRNTADQPNPNGNAGDQTRFTLGGRFWGKTAGFDYEALLAGQWGKWAGDTIQAWACSLTAGYTFADVPWKPRIGAGFDLATGDDNPGDGNVGTFDQVFPLGHAYMGYLDLFARQNITAARLDLTAWPVAKKVKTAIAWHAFWLHDDHDALYNVGGGPGRRDATGHSGKEVGHELDLTVLWKVDARSVVLLGYSHLWDGDFIANTGVSEDPDLFYVQYKLKF
jgi:hypothetical protein